MVLVYVCAMFLLGTLRFERPCISQFLNMVRSTSRSLWFAVVGCLGLELFFHIVAYHGVFVVLKLFLFWRVGHFSSTRLRVFWVLDDFWERRFWERV